MILLMLALACVLPHQHGLAVLHPDPVCLGHIARVQIPSMGGRDTLQLLLLVAHTASRFTAPVHIDVGGKIHTSSLDTLYLRFTIW